jgi:hypothetical protein
MPRSAALWKGWTVKVTARTPADLQRAAEMIATLPAGKWEIEVVRRREKRSGQQNRLLWAIYTAIADATGHTPEEIHDYFKHKFLPPRVIELGGEAVEVPGSTAIQDVPAFSEYVERVQAFAASELGVQL